MQKPVATPQGAEPSRFVDASGRKQLKGSYQVPFQSSEK